MIRDILVAYPKIAQSAAARADPLEREGQRRTRANNILIGMREYGLMERLSHALTPVGISLLDARTDEERYEQFARHILSECEGFEVLTAVKGMHDGNKAITKISLADELRTVYGFELPAATTRHQTLLNWLSLAEVVQSVRTRRGYEINEGRLEALTGATSADLAGLSVLTEPQRAFLRTLRSLTEVHGSQALSTQYVTELAIIEHGRLFPEDNRARLVYEPLQEAGWLVRQHKSAGRGGKSGAVIPTPKLLALDASLLGERSVWGIPSELRPLLNTPLSEILSKLKASDKHTKGIALELLALQVATAIGLTPIRFRLRGPETGGAEVDLIAEGAHLHFSRWLFQCKNTGAVDLSDLAKEVGMAVILRAHVIVLVTTGSFRSTVENHADTLAETSHLQTVLIDAKLLEQFRTGGPRTLLDFFRRSAAATMRLKSAQAFTD